MEEKTLNIITWVSVAFIIIAAFWAWRYIMRQKKSNTLLAKRRWIDQLPSLISTLGVLGTFVGITIGLLFFDTDDLDNSIPKLLSGLKTAFFTSLAGMFGSLLLSRVVNSSFDKRDGGISDTSQAAGEICRAVSELKEQIKKQNLEQGRFHTQIVSLFDKISTRADELAGFRIKSENVEKTLNKSLEITKQQNETLQSITQKLNTTHKKQDTILQKLADLNTKSGETLEIISGMSTAQEEIATETKLFSTILRGEVDEIETKMGETNKLLTDKFDEFSELLKKSNTEALVEVMKKVTEEFQKQMNLLISKLIQENFEQLNTSVERLNTWQQENKAMIASLTRQYKDMAASFENTSVILNTVGNDTKELVSDGGKLQQIIDTLSKVMIDDKKFVEISTNLSDTAELTKQNMTQFDASTKTLNDWVKKQRNFVDSVKLLIAKLEELNKIKDYNEEFWKGTKRSLEEGVGYISQGSKTLNQQLTELDRQFYARLSTTLAELDTCIQAMIKGNNRR